MPHFLAKSIADISTPTSIDGVDFKFLAKNPRESLIGVEYKDKEFLLVQRDKGDKQVLKTEKFTRVSPVSIMKESIKAFAKATDTEIASSNLEDRKVKRSLENFKDIEYFINDYNYDKEIWIEIGFGSGRHLLNQAKNNPDVQIIGLEIHKPSIEQVLGQVDIQGLDNVYVVDYDARLFMEFIKSNHVGRIFVHFPVPWDKKPHRRVYSKEFINEAMRVLKVGGTLELRTDSPNYYEYVTGLFSEMSLDIDIRKNQDLEVSSKYEDRWKKLEKDIYDVTLTNDIDSKPLNLESDFSLNISKSLDEIESKVSREPYVYDGYFVHFKDFFKIDDDSGLIKIAFGSFNRPENKYILITKDSARYYPLVPVPSNHNRLAHIKIEKLIHE
jgi:tRNA (guanine-N7-)-methyltransferase